MDVNSLLDQAKEVCGVSYDKDLAPRLGVRPSAISNYRKGVSHPDAVVCATLAGLTGVPLARVLGVIGEARAISREEKAVWRKLAATAMLLAISVGMYAMPTAARASGIHESPVCILCKLTDGARQLSTNAWTPTQLTSPELPRPAPELQTHRRCYLTHRFSHLSSTSISRRCPGSSRFGANVKPSGGPVCGSTQVACGAPS